MKPEEKIVLKLLEHRKKFNSEKEENEALVTALIEAIEEYAEDLFRPVIKKWETILRMGEGKEITYSRKVLTEMINDFKEQLK